MYRAAAQGCTTAATWFSASSWLGYTESPFALATVWCLVALHRRWMWTASVVAGLAMTGRLAGHGRNTRAITPLLLILALINVVAISRFYHTLWVS